MKSRILVYVGLGAAVLLLVVLLTTRLLPLALGLALIGVILLAAVFVTIASRPKRYRGIQSAHAVATYDGKVRLGKSEVLGQVRRNIARSNRFSETSYEEGRLHIKVGASALTWGEDVEILLEAEGPDKTHFIATCRHRLSTVIVDFGQSARDLSFLLEGLQAEERDNQDNVGHSR